ncbi:MAG TPA: FadR/GntR family transcriptional regulator [Rhizomicrobium sp.]|nr:FadR/GntR family transcriptional regulator [Rhizomicrobium sp.]
MTKSKPSVRIPAKIASDLGVKIVSGRFKVGSILDGEVEASGQRKVSRSAYREAVRILVAKGLVESRPKIGTRVSTVDRWHLLDPDVLAWMFAREPHPHLLTSLFELRRLVEPEAAALAAQRRSEKQLARMGTAVEEMARKTLVTNAGRQADQLFHSTLLEASGNPFLETLSSSVAAAINWSTLFKSRMQRPMRDSIPDHRKVYEAVAAADSKAARATMIELIDLALTDTTRAQTAKAKPSKRGPTGR